MEEHILYAAKNANFSKLEIREYVRSNSKVFFSKCFNDVFNRLKKEGKIVYDSEKGTYKAS